MMSEIQPQHKADLILPDCSFSSIKLLSLQTQLPGSLPQGGCQLGPNICLPPCHICLKWDQLTPEMQTDIRLCELLLYMLFWAQLR